MTTIGTGLGYPGLTPIFHIMIEWYSDPALRRRCLAGLNKGEAAHKLKRAVFFHERGEIRDRSFESQAFRASGLNLVVSAIVH